MIRFNNFPPRSENDIELTTSSHAELVSLAYFAQTTDYRREFNAYGYAVGTTLGAAIEHIGNEDAFHDFANEISSGVMKSVRHLVYPKTEEALSEAFETGFKDAVMHEYIDRFEVKEPAV